MSEAMQTGLRNETVSRLCEIDNNLIDAGDNIGNLTANPHGLSQEDLSDLHEAEVHLEKSKRTVQMIINRNRTAK